MENKTTIIKTIKGIKLIITAIIAGLVYILIVQSSVVAAENDEAVLVDVDNFVRAETAINFNKTLALVNGEVNTIFHYREPNAVRWAKRHTKQSRYTLQWCYCRYQQGGPP